MDGVSSALIEGRLFDEQGMFQRCVSCVWDSGRTYGQAGDVSQDAGHTIGKVRMLLICILGRIAKSLIWV